MIASTVQDPGQRWPASRRYVLAIGIAGAATLFLALNFPPLEVTTVALVYLLGVLVVATFGGLGPGLLASILCFFALNYFFLSPRYTFHVAGVQDLMRLTSFLVVALMTSSLAERARTAAERERSRAIALRELYQLSQTIGARVDLDSILAEIAAATCRLLAAPASAIAIMGEDGVLSPRAQSGTFAPGLRPLAAPVRDGAAVLGVIRVYGVPSSIERGGEAQALLEMLAAQVRLALDRARLVERTAAAQALTASDTLKSALIASVSHDLRTPLAVIKGATSTLLADDLAWDAATQRMLIQTVDYEVDQLNRIVGDMLVMSRIDSGALPTEREAYDIADVLSVAISAWEQRTGACPIQVELQPDLPPVQVNPALIERVVGNLIDNAGKYAPGQTILLSVQAEPGGDELRVQVRDHGPGIAPDDLPHLFEKFYRGHTASETHGTGLGLAICKGIVDAHGGRIWAEQAPDGGAVFAFTLPCAARDLAVEARQ